MPRVDDEIMLKKARKFFPLAKKLEPSLFHLNAELVKARSKLNLVEHIAVSLYKGVYTSFMIGTIILLGGIIMQDNLIIKVGLISYPLFFLVNFYSSLYYPRLLVRKRGRKIEEDLPYALRHLLIQVKAGVPLYHAMVAVSEGYGEASKEFRHIIENINAGKSQVEALEDSISKNPSLPLRRALWQLLTAVKTGADLTKSLEAVVDEILKEQLIAIKKYGQELNPWTLMYMMFGIIVPSLGITFLMILSSFVGLVVDKSMLAVGLFTLLVFQYMFVQVVRSKRPSVKI